MAAYGLPTWPWANAQADDLPPAEHLLLESSRRWAAAASQGHPARLALRPPFVAEDAIAAIAPLDALLRLAAGLRPLELGCLCCPGITASEATILLACGLTQRGARREALAVFLRWLPPAAAYAAMPHAIHIGCGLRQGGLLLRNPLRRG